MGANEALIEFPEKLQPLFKPHRYKVVYGGRGKGGSWGIARALLLKGWERQIRVLCTREVQKTIKESVHQLLKDQIDMLGLGGFYDVKETQIVGTNGTLFSFAGLKSLTVQNLKSYEGYDIAWVEEAENISKKSWGVLIPTIRRPGSEIWVNLNPQLDTDETYVRFVVSTPPDCALIPMSYRDNPWFPEVLEKERLYLKEHDPKEYENIWEGKCRSSVPGAIYADEIDELLRDKRYRPVPYDPLLKVHTIWDLGWNDSMSIGFVQRLHSEVRWIDFLEDDHKTYDWYVAEIKKKNYNLGRAFLPHDGKAKNPQTGMSAEDILRKLGLNPSTAPRPMDVEAGIKATRMRFRQMYFDEVKCASLINHLKRYRRTIPVTTGEPSTPLHDEHSHAADMVREAVSRLNDMRNEEADKPLPIPNTGINFPRR